MGKEDDLWDDSALVHAFDDAISIYKTMQCRGQNDSSKAGGELVGSMEESLSTFVDGIHEPRFPRRSAYIPIWLYGAFFRLIYTSFKFGIGSLDI